MKAQEVKDLIEGSGGKVDEISGPLPDGSGFAVASFPLPKDHWLYKPGYNVPPMPFCRGTVDPGRETMAEEIRAAARYAIRASTMNGKDNDFDPDAMVQNMVVGMLGYFTPTGLSDDDWAPDPETEEDWAADLFDDDVRAAVAELPPIKWPR